jgi:Asp-tRNA(Asn)/Glu-tRNA(Gln) amidotransferase A subunit family amidase
VRSDDRHVTVDRLEGVAAAAWPSAVDLVAGLREGRLDRLSLLAESLRRIDASKVLNAFRWARPDELLATATAASVAGKPLAGLPIAVKDCLDTAGIPTTSGSLVDIDRVPRDDAIVWRRLRDTAGAALLGKTHMSEFAYRSHHPALGWVRNPRNLDRATGGSSSGSAAAVAAGIAAAAVGTDTGGSVRIPAAYCGVVGLKGTRGGIENVGVVPLSPTMDHVGVLARSVTDAALVYEQMTETTLPLVNPDTLELPPAEPREIRVGLERGYFVSAAQPAVLACWERAAAALATARCELVQIDLPDAARWRAAHARILLHEAWTYHGDRVRAGAPYGPVFRNAMLAAEGITTAQYARALATREAAVAAMAALFRDVDVLLTPTCPTVAPAIEEGRRAVAYTRYTTLAAFAGLPAISIPAGTGFLGLPVGVQLIAGHGGDRTVVRAAALLERLLLDDRTTRA